MRAFARDGLLAAERGPGGRYRFTVPDIILLRTAQELREQGVSARRIRRALRRLREQLPSGRPLSAVRIVASGDEVLVQDRKTVWEPVTEQVAFDFAVEDLAARVEPFARRRAREREAEGAMEADDWYDLAFDLEAVSLDEARRGYRRTLALEPGHPEALVNLGRLLHEEGDLPEAEAHYRRALEENPDHPVARYNLGVALEDRGALEAEGDMQRAVLHLATYKRLRGR